MAQGKVRSFFKERHYGFLFDEETGSELFFHETDINGPIPAKNALVSFDLGAFGGRKKAINVCVLTPKIVLSGGGQ